MSYQIKVVNIDVKWLTIHMYIPENRILRLRLRLNINYVGWVNQGL